ncbi:hypothetical protein JOM56_004157 [Amanita muscaria]
MSPVCPNVPDCKGKSRAPEPTENTPLLASSSHTYSLNEGPSVVAVSNRRLRVKLARVFFLSLGFCFFTFVLLAWLAWSYASTASNIPPEELFATSVVLGNPSNVEILRVEQGTVWLSVQGKLGVDAGNVIGVGRNPKGDGFFTNIWKSLGRWGVSRLGKATIQLSPIHITPEYNTSLGLVSVNVATFDVPLNPDPPPDDSWLTEVTLDVTVQTTKDASAIQHFLHECWARGNIDIRAHMDKVSVKGGALYEQSWRNWLNMDMTKVRVPLRFKIPPLPGLPNPGDTFPSIEQLVTLQEFHVISNNDKLTLDATATVINPLPTSLRATTPSLPFTVSIHSLNETVPSAIPLASVSTLPFVLTHPNITLHVTGTVLPLQPSSSGALSDFLMRYLSGKPNAISISTPILPDLSVTTTFPAPNPRPQLLRDVTIRDMKVKPKGSSFVANGIVFVKLILPKGMDIALDVRRVFPDVIVSDGDMQDGLEAPPDIPLPDPLPENAFGHIRPDDWLPSLCIREKSQEGDGATYSITAAIVDVPLGVLPGREKQFSTFVSKVIFGSEAVAGITGSASVIVNVEGLPVNRPGQHHELELDGLPFRGRVPVGRKGTIWNDQDLEES